MRVCSWCFLILFLFFCFGLALNDLLASAKSARYFLTDPAKLCAFDHANYLQATDYKKNSSFITMAIESKVLPASTSSPKSSHLISAALELINNNKTSKRKTCECLVSEESSHVLLIFVSHNFFLCLLDISWLQSFIISSFKKRFFDSYADCLIESLNQFERGLLTFSMVHCDISSSEQKSANLNVHDYQLVFSLDKWTERLRLLNSKVIRSLTNFFLEAYLLSSTLIGDDFEDFYVKIWHKQSNANNKWLSKDFIASFILNSGSCNMLSPPCITLRTLYSGRMCHHLITIFIKDNFNIIETDLEKCIRYFYAIFYCTFLSFTCDYINQITEIFLLEVLKLFNKLYANSGKEIAELEEQAKIPDNKDLFNRILMQFWRVSKKVHDCSRKH